MHLADLLEDKGWNTNDLLPDQVIIADRIADRLRTWDMYRIICLMEDLRLVPDGYGDRMFTLTEAAHVTGLSRVTIRRYLDRNWFPNAVRQGRGAKAVWLIPAEDLEARGLSTDVLPVPPGVDDPVEAVQLRLAAAEALASERAREIERLERELERVHGLLRHVLGGDR